MGLNNIFGCRFKQHQSSLLWSFKKDTGCLLIEAFGGFGQCRHSKHLIVRVSATHWHNTACSLSSDFYLFVQRLACLFYITMEVR